MPIPVTTTDPVRGTWEQMPSPDELRAAVPTTADSVTTSRLGRVAARKILDGADDRLLVIAGPCALQDRQSALDYAGNLREVAEQLSDDLFVIMRTYVEKPRSSVGWTGIAHAPDLLGPPDPQRGFLLARSILADITGMTVPVAVEWLTAIGAAYLEDLVSWGCIGARSVEAQTYRQLASALAMPVGMKNRTDGAIDVAVNAIQVARHKQAFLGVTPGGAVALTRTAGNPDCHIVLRGGSNGPNHHPAAIRDALRQLAAAGLSERLVIDASHGNSAKDHDRQRVVATEIGDQIKAGNTAIRGVMLESFLLAGRQDPVAGERITTGRSITDACMSWPVTASTLTELAAAARARRRRDHRRRVDTVPEPRSRAPRVGRSPAATAVALIQAGLFDTYMVYERAGVWTVAGGRQAAVSLDATHIRARQAGGEQHRRPWRSRPLVCLGEALAELPMPEWTAFGWLAFDLAHLIHGRHDLADAGDLAHLIVPRAEVRIDDAGVGISCTDTQLRDRIHEVLAGVAPEPPPPPRTTGVELAAEWYEGAVADAVREIHNGSFQKVILSRSVPVDATIDLPRSYLLGRAANTPARSFLLDIGRHRAFGFCPETILEADADGSISTQPLAGTRSFGNGQDMDRELRTELLNDPKELYEHMISVKLAHDEISRVCAPGTVSVSDLMSVKERGRVQHLGSRVRGELAANRSAWDALEVVFPAITSSGVPKDAACQYIARTEPHSRGLYAGAVLTATHDGALDAGLVLRTFFEENGQRRLQAGAGIIGTSRPEREYEETCEKLRSIAPFLVQQSEQDSAAQPAHVDR